MLSDTPNLRVPAVRSTLVAIGLIAGHMFSLTPARAQTPLASLAVPSAKPVEAATTPTMPAGMTPAATTPAATASPTVDSAKRALCERYAAAISGQAKERALLEKAEVKGLAQKVPDLAVCGAVTQDSDEACNVLEGDMRFMCRSYRALLHEMRKPQGRSYLFTDVHYELCKSVKEVAPFCDAVRAAFRSGDPNKCPTVAPVHNPVHPFMSKASAGGPPPVVNCRAYVSLDPSLCHGEGPDAKAMVEECRRDLAHHADLAKGLKAMTKSESESEPMRALASAALGKGDACKPVVQAAVDVCMGREMPWWVSGHLTPPTPNPTQKSTAAPVSAAPVSGASVVPTGVAKPSPAPTSSDATLGAP